MKLPFFSLCLIFIITNSIVGQNTSTLYLKGNKLTGKCNHSYFTGFEIELDTIYSKIDSAILFNQLPRIGSINFKNKVDIPTEFTITERAGFLQIMFRFRTTYLTFDNLDIQKQTVSFTIDNDPKVPVTENDLKIIRLAKEILKEEKYWNRQDDRQCGDDLANKSYSIYCALRIASLEIEGKYNHRNAVLQKLRHLIVEKYPTKKWNHRLMDFNNLEELVFKDISNILDKIEEDPFYFEKLIP